MTVDLPLVFTVLMGFAILMYVVLDGYDLGVGMLMPAGTPEEQGLMVASIGPYWDANETWLVLGIGLLLAAFPVAHGVVLGALYLPVAAMLIGLMLRGVAFEFRVKAEGWHRELWNWLFWFGSFLASFAQGVMLGRYVTGFAPGFGYWVFAVLTGASLCGGYVLLGATWLVLRTEGDLQQKALAWTRWGLLWVALGVALVSAATPLASATVRAKWFDFPNTLPLMLLPLASVLAWLWVWRSPAARVAGSDRMGPVRRQRSDLRARVPRPRLQPVSLRGDGSPHDLGCRRASFRALDAVLRNRGGAAFSCRLYDICLPGVWGQGEGPDIRLNRSGVI